MSKIIYHYTNLNALISILSNDEILLWATNVSYLNDPNEILEGIDTVQKIWSKPIHPGSFRNYYVSSFSKDQDSLVMWSQYASKGNGCALGFDRDIITPSFLFMVNCTYGIEETSKSLSDILNLTQKGHFVVLDGPPLSKEQIIEFKNTNDTNILIQTCLSAKNISYRHENEFRGVIYEDNTSNIRFRQTLNFIAPYTIVKIPKHALKQIVIGPNSNELIVLQSILHMLRLKDYDLNEIELVSSKVPFRG